MLQATDRFDRRPSPCRCVSARQYQSLLHDLRTSLRKHGIPISRSSGGRCNRAARPRGRRGARLEVTRHGWWYAEQARRYKQSARSRAHARLVIPDGCACLRPFKFGDRLLRNRELCDLLFFNLSFQCQFLGCHNTSTLHIASKQRICVTTYQILPL